VARVSDLNLLNALTLAAATYQIASLLINVYGRGAGVGRTREVGVALGVGVVVGVGVGLWAAAQYLPPVLK
jgi:hypothetical protein